MKMRSWLFAPDDSEIWVRINPFDRPHLSRAQALLAQVDGA